MVKTGNLFLIIILAFSLIALAGCTETNIQTPPFTTSQFVSRATDLNYSNWLNGDYNNMVLVFDGNKISVADANDLNVALPDLSNLIPYTGANKNVDLGDQNITATSFFGDGSNLTGIEFTDTNVFTAGIMSKDNNSFLIDLNNYGHNAYTSGLIVGQGGALTGAFNPRKVNIYYDGTASVEILRNEIYTTTPSTSQTNQVLMNNTFYKLANDGYSGVFTGDNVTGLQNKIDIGGTLTNNPTVTNASSLIATDSTIYNRIKWNSSKSLSETTYGNRMFLNLVSAEKLGTGNISRNVYGDYIQFALRNGNNYLTSFKAIYIPNITVGATDTVTNGLYSIYSLPDINSVINGSVAIGKNTDPQYPLDVSGESAFDGNMFVNGYVHADGYITNSVVADMSKTSALSKLDNINEWVTSKGDIDYSKHYAGTSYKVKEIIGYENKPVTNAFCEGMKDEKGNDLLLNDGTQDTNCYDKTEIIKTPIYKEVTKQGLDLEVRVAEMEKMIWELKNALCKTDPKHVFCK